MSTFVARSKDKACFGVYAAKTIKELFWLVDVEIDPTICEYKRVTELFLFFNLNPGYDADEKTTLGDSNENSDFIDDTMACNEGWKSFDRSKYDFYHY